MRIEDGRLIGAVLPYHEIDDERLLELNAKARRERGIPGGYKTLISKVVQLEREKAKEREKLKLSKIAEVIGILVVVKSKREIDEQIPEPQETVNKSEWPEIIDRGEEIFGIFEDERLPPQPYDDTSVDELTLQ
jgi:glutamate/tyrosine decarboxylase-like PLP-dependent enzyme